MEEALDLSFDRLLMIMPKCEESYLMVNLTRLDLSLEVSEYGAILKIQVELVRNADHTKQLKTTR